MEKDIAQKTSEIGPDTNGKPAAGSATRQCWSQTQSKPNKSKTSFKAEYERKVNNHQDSLESNSSTFSWFVPDEQSQRPNTSSGLPAHNKSRGSQTNQSLFRQYYEKKDKARFIIFKHFYQKLLKWPPLVPYYVFDFWESRGKVMNTYMFLFDWKDYFRYGKTLGSGQMLFEAIICPSAEFQLKVESQLFFTLK